MSTEFDPECSNCQAINDCELEHGPFVSCGGPHVYYDWNVWDEEDADSEEDSE